jgi:hypothetical protein
VLGGSGKKGLVALGLDGFKKPFAAHDLEIRLAQNLKHALELGEFATRLARQRDELQLHPRQFGGKLDPFLGNVGGALEYAGTVLGRAHDPERRAVGKAALALAEEVYKHQPSRDPTLPRGLRKKVHEFVKLNRLEDLLADEQTFLRPA